MYINNGKNKDMWIKSVRKNIVAERGITLLALIITVVIMIILAAVTINVTLGDGGLINQAQHAAEQTANATKSEQEQIDDLVSQLNDILSGSEIPEPDPSLPDGTITIGNPVWAGDGTASVTVSSSASGYTIEYQINGTSEGGWTDVTNGNISGLKHGDTVNVRITDGDKTSQVQSKQISDTANPGNASIMFNKTELIVGEALTATVDHVDNESGVNISQSKWVFNTSSSNIGTEDGSYTGTFTSDGEQITLDSNTAGEFYLHVLTVDVAGNRTETISERVTISGVAGDITKKGDVTWSDGTATLELETTQTQFTIEYRVNEGGWTDYTGPITGLNDGDTVTARLKYGSTTGDEVQFTIEDTKAPTVNVTAQGESTTNSISVNVQASDNESGMADNVTYTYYIKQSTELDSSYNSPSGATGIASNTYTFTGLTAGTSYDIKVEVNGDKAGHVGTGFLTGQQTGTIPGGEEGVEQGRITFGPANWADGKASVTISTDTGLQLQYQINAIDPDGWTPIENNGTVSNLEAGDTVYARLTDGTNFGDYASTNILDNEVPAQATIQPNTTNLVIGETLTATVTHSDAKSGVDINASGWVLNTNASAMGTDDTSAYTGKFTTNGEIITLDSSNAGTYYLHVLTTDVAGNKTETVSEAITISAITGTVTQNGQVSWSAGKATLVLQSSESQYKIVYKINGEGNWTEYDGTSITGLSHGDKVTACLTNASQTTFGPEAEFEIKDEKAPTVTVTAQGSPTTNSITVTAQAVDNESGMKANPTYTFQYKTSGAGSYTTPSDASDISNATYTFTGLTQGTTYDIQVIVKGDIAGNTGTGTTQATTATVPGADEGLVTGSITASPATWSGGKASTTLTTTTNFKIQYQVNGTIEGSWSAAANSPVAVNNLNHNDTVYARLTDGANPGNYAAINILDGTPPTVSVAVDEVTDTTIAVTVTANDKESGLADSNAYKYYINDEETPRTTSSSNTYKYEGLTATTPYNIKVEVVDKGNNTGTGTTSATTAEPPTPEIGDIKPSTPEEVDIFDNTTKVVDESGDEVWIPGGFGIDEESATDADDGIVITDEKENEFVWIPVPDYTTMYEDTAGSVKLNGVETTTSVYSKLRVRSGDSYTAGVPGSTNVREPDLVVGSGGTSYDASSQYYQNILGYGSTKLMADAFVDEYTATYNSIKKYKGFYIGRYELTGSVSDPTVQRDQTVLTNQNWYNLKKACSNIVSSSDAQSEMIYGNQWDEVMSWLVKTGEKTDSEVNSNSTSWGNYSNSTGNAAEGSGTKRTSGYSEYWKANNIYDLAGNCWEWTQEADNTYNRVCRGGLYYDFGSDYPASDRGNSIPNGFSSNDSARSALYIKVGL